MGGFFFLSGHFCGEDVRKFPLKATKMISIYGGWIPFFLIFTKSQKSVFQHPKVGGTTNHFMGYDGFGPPKNGWGKLPLRNWENDEPWILGVPSYPQVAIEKLGE